ncbi:MAG TPA: hypothetical protein VG942_08165 [Hyphomonadaceae bacterium]|nr:hypothetical protein [Hyphomonadaceae bacterium]
MPRSVLQALIASATAARLRTAQNSCASSSKHPQHRAPDEDGADPANFIDLQKLISTMFWHHGLEIESALANARSGRHIFSRKRGNRGGKVTLCSAAERGFMVMANTVTTCLQMVAIRLNRVLVPPVFAGVMLASEPVTGSEHSTLAPHGKGKGERQLRART